MERTTSQKEIILNYLKSAKTHPSAETVYFSVKKDLPRISKSTVYRILKNLIEKGKIQELKKEISYYDGDTSSHSHFFVKNAKRYLIFLKNIKNLKIKN